MPGHDPGMVPPPRGAEWPLTRPIDFSRRERPTINVRQPKDLSALAPGAAAGGPVRPVGRGGVRRRWGRGAAGRAFSAATRAKWSPDRPHRGRGRGHLRHEQAGGKRRPVPVGQRPAPRNAGGRDPLAAAVPRSRGLLPPEGRGDGAAAARPALPVRRLGGAHLLRPRRADRRHAGAGARRVEPEPRHPFQPQGRGEHRRLRAAGSGFPRSRRTRVPVLGAQRRS